MTFLKRVGRPVPWPPKKKKFAAFPAAKGLAALPLILYFFLVSFAFSFEWKGEALQLLNQGTNTTWAENAPDFSNENFAFVLPESLGEAGSAHVQSKNMASVQEQIDLLRSQLKEKPLSQRLHIDLGTLYLKARRFNEAARTFYETFQRFPGSRSAVERLGFSMLTQGDHLSGYDIYTRLTEAETGYLIGYKLNLGAAAFHLKKHDEAIQHFEAFVEQRPNNWKGLYNLGVAKTARGDSDAIDFFKQGLKVAPEKPYALAGMTRIYKEQQQTNAFTSSMARLKRTLSKEDIKHLFSLLDMPVFLLENPSAPFFSDSKLTIPWIKKIWHNHLLRVPELNQLDTWDTEQAYREALAIQPTSRLALRSLFHVYAHDGEFTMQAMCANYAWMLNARGDVASTRDRLMRKMTPTNLASNSYEKIFSLVMNAAENNDLVRMEGLLRAFLKEYPGHINALENLGALYLQKEDWTMASMTFGLLHYLDPEAGRHANNLSASLIQSGLSHVAYSIFKKEVDTLSGLANYVKAANVFGKQVEAEEALKKWYDKDPENVATSLAYIKQLKLNGKKEEAKSCLLNLKNHFPDHVPSSLDDL